jgi:hypothetical protein
MRRAFNCFDASITSWGVATKLGVTLCFATEPSEKTVTSRWCRDSRLTSWALKTVAWAWPAPTTTDV